MGLISFAQGVGASIFGTGAAKDSPADALRKEVEKHGLDVSGVKIAVVGETVTLTGTTKTTEDAEKIALAVGNTTGVRTVDNRIAAANGAAASKFYTVASGDTLSKIAETNYGHGNADKYDVIFQANRPMLSNPDKIYPGQVLRIPPLS